jgi:hypothetical protein
LFLCLYNGPGVFGYSIFCLVRLLYLHETGYVFILKSILEAILRAKLATEI